MELWDLYDKDRRPLGRTHQRGLPVPPGAYHLAVIVVILNPKGEVLLTRRAPEKDACPGWWENTGGSVLAGETSLEAITRELREETGLAARPEEFTLLLREDCRTDAHFDIYALTWEGAPEDIRFQAGETDAARWVPLADWEAVAGTGQTLCPASGEDYKQELYRRIGQYLQGQRHFPQNATPELWDLYDKDRQPLGRTIQRGQPMQEGEYHLGVTVAVFNTKGEILSTRRAPGKSFAGQWELPAGGVQAGESPVSAACRELWEETGISAAADELTLLLWQVRPHLHAAFYGLTKEVPLEQIVLQPRETDGARWVPFDVWIQEQEQTGKDSPEWHRQFIQPLYVPLREYKDGKRFFETHT
jgi:8-oxo-dGTP diphosphatase